MKIYDSFGTFDATKKEFNLAAQTTIIGFDEYYISAYYNICNDTRYAILAILQTKLGNDNDLSLSKANAAILDSEIKFSGLNNSYVTVDDLDINHAVNGDVINVIVHHGIGFDPIENEYDDLYIKNYKAETYTYYATGSPPGAKGSGGLM